MSSALKPDALRSRLGRGLLFLAVGCCPILTLPARDSERRPRSDTGTERSLIFFPPLPPPLDPARPIPLPAVFHPSAPGELADYVGEFFYPQLSSRLHEQSLTGKQRQQLESYRASKQALQQEIRRELATLGRAEPAIRREALQALARRQAPQLAALAQAAEQLRADLLAPDRDWNAFREWRLTDRERRAFSPLEIAQVMRAFAFYEHRLLVTQRGLLREIAFELLLAGTTETNAAAAQTHVFFSPSPARVLWRDDAPPAVTETFARFQAKKAVLKKELYDAICRYDSRIKTARSAWLAELAAKQATELAALESLAEEIRVGLAPLPPVGLALPPSSLGPQLAEAIAALQRRRHLLRMEKTLELEAISERLREKKIYVRVNFRFDPEGLKFAVIPLSHRSPELLRQVKEVGAELSALADAYGRELVEIANAEDARRSEIAAVIGSQKPQAIDDAIANAVRAVDAKRNAHAFAEYHVAVFEPGLSPEQRRVLLDGATEQLDLPLPRGELQPWHRSESW